MSEQIPERIEREMFEIRERTSPNLNDLRKHIEPQVVAEQVKQTVRQRLQEAMTRLKARVQAALEEKRREVVGSAKRQISLARKVGENGDTAPLTDAVKSDPRPLALLAIVLTVTLFTVRRISGGRDDR